MIGGVELTMVYNNMKYERGYEPGICPEGAPPNPADMRALIRKYCAQTGVHYRDLATAHGAADSH